MVSRLIRHIAAWGILLVLCISACGQTLTVTDPTYSTRKLFESTVNHVITGMAADDLGNVYYIETDVFGTGNTRLYRRSALNYAAVTELYDFGNAVGGSFVVFSNGKLYFGESTNGNIYTINADGSGSADPLGVVASSYDATVYNGTFLVLYSHNFGSDSRLSGFSLVGDGAGGQMLGLEEVILTASGDYMGSFEYSGGDLYYGASGFGTKRGLYRFDGEELESASGPLTPDAEHLWGATTTNHVSGLALGSGDDLWKTGNPGTDLLRFDRFNTGVDSVGFAGGNSSLGQLDFAGNSLFLNVTDLNASRSAVFTVSVPEPSISVALLAAGAVLTMRRRR